MPAEISELPIPGLLLIRPKIWRDERGFFFETYARAELTAAGFGRDFVQDNHSGSRDAGTVRGLHFQAPPHAQDKLVRVARGRVLDVAVDIRIGSPHYGKHVAVELSAENGHQLLVPCGFAHGFQTLEPGSEVLYKVTDYYTPSAEGGLLWDDPDLDLAWPVPADAAIVNARDSSWPRLLDLKSPF